MPTTPVEYSPLQQDLPKARTPPKTGQKAVARSNRGSYASLKDISNNGNSRLRGGASVITDSLSSIQEDGDQPVRSKMSFEGRHTEGSMMPVDSVSGAAHKITLPSPAPSRRQTGWGTALRGKEAFATRTSTAATAEGSEQSDEFVGFVESIPLRDQGPSKSEDVPRLRYRPTVPNMNVQDSEARVEVQMRYRPSVPLKYRPSMQVNDIDGLCSSLDGLSHQEGLQAIDFGALCEELPAFRATPLLMADDVPEPDDDDDIDTERDEQVRVALLSYRSDWCSVAKDASGDAKRNADVLRSWFLSNPFVVAIFVALSRSCWLLDAASDFEAGWLLWLDHAWRDWAFVIFVQICLPYFCLWVMLGPVASSRLAQLAPACFELVPRAARLVWFCFGLPLLLLIDAALILRFFFVEPKTRELYHYMRLRSLFSVFSAVPQVVLQSYLVWSLFNSSLGDEEKVKRFRLTVIALMLSVLVSVYNLWTIVKLIRKAARLQTSGQVCTFLHKMLRLGEDFAPLGLFEALESASLVSCEFDLCDVSEAELFSLALTARVSDTLVDLRFSDASFFERHWRTNLPGCRRFLSILLRTKNLSRLDLGSGIESMELVRTIQAKVNEVMLERPSLRLVHIAGHFDVHNDCAEGEKSWKRLPISCVCMPANPSLQFEIELMLPEKRQERFKKAIETGALDDIRVLLMKNPEGTRRAANAEIASSGLRPLHLAVQMRQPGVIGLLLAANANPNKQKQHGISPVYTAAQENSSEALRLLLDASGNPNQQLRDGTSPAFIAAQHNCTECLDLLLRARADPNLRHITGASPVFMAAMHNAADAVSLLLTARGDPNLQKLDGLSPVHIAVQKRADDALTLLLAARGDANLRQEDGAAALHVAALSEPTSAAVMMLLGARADLDQCSEGGLTPLQAALRAGSARTAELLTAARAQRRHDASSSMGCLDFSQSEEDEDQLVLVEEGVYRTGG